MKKNKSFLLIILISLMLFQLLPSCTYADGDININVKLGYDSFYKLSNSIPIYVDVENNLKDINGELQIETLDENENIVLYTMEVSLPQGSAKQFVMYVPMTRFSSKLKVNIVQGKKTVVTKTTNISAAWSADTLVIGMLSDDYESIRYINTIPTNSYASVKTATVHLNEKLFPDTLEALRMFNVLVVNNYDTSKLSEKQYEALKSWVNDGGLLLIGTGPAYTKTLGIFKDDFVKGSIGDLQTVATDALNKLMDDTSASQPMNLSAAALDLTDSQLIASEGELPILQRIEKSRGVVAVAAFDFGLEPLASWVGNKAFAESMLKAVLPAYYTSVYMDKGIIIRESGYALNGSLQNIPELPQPKTKNMLLIFIVYILIIAPISYIILKRMDKRELMWITVPALALVFSIIIYISGHGTRLTEPVANIISVVDFDVNGNTLTNTYAGIFTPAKSNLRLEAEEGMTIKPLSYSNGMYPYRGNNGVQRVVSKIALSPKPYIEFYDTGVWSMKNVILENKEKPEGQILSQLSYFNGKLTGTIANQSGFDLEGCFIVTGSQYIPIGDIKKGEAINVNGDIKQSYGNRYDLINAIYKDPYSTSVNISTLSDEEIMGFRMNIQRRQIFEYYYQNENISNSNIKFIGWSKSPLAGDILVNGKAVKKIEKSFIASDVEISYKNGNAVEYPFGHVSPKIINNLVQGNYDEYSSSIYGRGAVEVYFELDKNIIPSEIQLKINNSSNSKAYAWNTTQNGWEEVSTSLMTLKDEAITNYVQDNTVKLKFELSDDSITLPQISVKGSVK